METKIERDKNSSPQQMQIVERHERVINYLYPIIQRTPRKHGIVRDRFLECLFQQTDLIMTAGKSGQISKIYAADANLAMLRFYLRFYRESIRHITVKQEQHALALISEVGAMLNGWIKSKKGN